MKKDELLQEITFKAVKSSGAGGQHVNKVSSKVELHFDIENSKNLTESEKFLLTKNLSNRITSKGFLILTASQSRSQHTNKDQVIKRFFRLVKQGLTVPKTRKPTSLSRAQKQKRLKLKKKNAEKKALRKKPNLD